jgi:copper homeostasis protein
LLVEICVSDAESAVAAEQGGADRIELCADMAAGGTTPSAATIAETRRVLSIPVHVLIRPRAGGFVYAEAELAAMRDEIEMAKRLGSAGVVLGALSRDGTIDGDQTAALVSLARPMQVTFHKAFDETPCPEASVDALIGLGVERVLSSGGQPTTFQGITTLAKMVDRAGGRIAVMAGGRLDLGNLKVVIEQSGVREVHLGSAAIGLIDGANPALPGNGSQTSAHRTDAQRVAAIVALARRS